MIGVLLIGGKSRRMQVPKHLLKWENRPLGLHLSSLLERLLDRQPVIVGDGPDFPGGEHLTRISDWTDNGGPAAGIASALHHANGEEILVLASDLPLMTIETLTWIVQQPPRPEHHAIWPRLATRSFGEPLAAVYRPSLLEIMIQALDSGIRRLTDIVPRHLRSEPRIPTHLESAFTNVNTPHEWKGVTSNHRGSKHSILAEN